MKRSGKCPKCGGTDILPDVKVEDKTYGSRGEQTLVTYRNPDALIIRDRHETSTSAWVCGACGFVEIYAVNVDDIKVTGGQTSAAEPSPPAAPINLEYQLHITRAASPEDSERRSITLDEWYAYAANDSEVQRDLEAGPVHFFYVAHPLSPVPLMWDESGDIRVMSPDKPTVRKMIEIAQKLHARVQGDEGEFYDDVSEIPD